MTAILFVYSSIIHRLCAGGSEAGLLHHSLCHCNRSLWRSPLSTRILCSCTTSEGFSRPRFVLLLTTHLKGWTLPYQMHLCFSPNVKIFHNRVFREKIEAQLCCLPLHPVDGTDTALGDSPHLCSLWVGDRPRRERAPDLYSRCEFIFSLEKSFWAQQKMLTNLLVSSFSSLRWFLDLPFQGRMSLTNRWQFHSHWNGEARRSWNGNSQLATMALLLILSNNVSFLWGKSERNLFLFFFFKSVFLPCCHFWPWKQIGKCTSHPLLLLPREATE